MSRDAPRKPERAEFPLDFEVAPVSVAPLFGETGVDGIVMASINKKALAVLACPLSKAPLVLDGERLVSTDAETRRAYAIVDGFPNLLIPESTTLSPEEHRQVLEKHGVPAASVQVTSSRKK